MKLYFTEISPFARMARIVALEKGLADRIEFVPARTRQPDSPYYAINRSGRVPYLVCDDGTALEESTLICEYLDRLDGRPVFHPPAGDTAWAVRALEARARSMLEGLAVWARELMRPTDERSPTIIRHEAARAARMADFWEQTIDHPLMNGPLNLAQITLGCALGFDPRIPDLHWRRGHPKLDAWFEPLAARPSFAATAPPAYR
jgi:glutathione S-transferase